MYAAIADVCHADRCDRAARYQTGAPRISRLGLVHLIHDRLHAGDTVGEAVHRGAARAHGGALIAGLITAAEACVDLGLEYLVSRDTRLTEMIDLSDQCLDDVIRHRLPAAEIRAGRSQAGVDAEAIQWKPVLRKIEPPVAGRGQQHGHGKGRAISATMDEHSPPPSYLILSRGEVIPNLSRFDFHERPRITRCQDDVGFAMLFARR
ncbi:hypothetical protein B7486_23495 [cyanobacterium TDX16]|nr:hypothetical protein B7486_23495 [cyanobacterium TDX16]